MDLKLKKGGGATQKGTDMKNNKKDSLEDPK